MIKTAGIVFDFYDDDGAFLRDKLAGRDVPGAISDAEVLSSEALTALPDNAFAAVIRNGDETLRKYACTDAGNTMVSAIYFLGHRDHLPSMAKVKVAHNLLAACRFFEVVPPVELVKEASGRTLIKGDGAEIVAPRKGEKLADVSGTNLAPYTPMSRKKVKTASAPPVIGDPYVDVTGSEIAPTPNFEEYDPAYYALVGDDGTKSFPLVSWSQVKTAASFFEEQGKRLHPRTRREFCVKLAARADALGVEVPHEVKKYGSMTLASEGELDVAVESRRQMWRDGMDEARGLLDGLMEKRASIEPDIFAETLAQIDMLAGADRFWDRGIPDPWYTTFGIQKEAEWKWTHGNDVLFEGQLINFATKNRNFLEENFGDDLAEGLAKRPVETFESLPLTAKRVIARQAAQEEDGGEAASISHS